MILLAQIEEFDRVAKSYGLVVAILLGIVVFTLGMAIILIRWSKPLVEKVVTAHVETMAQLRENAAQQARSIDKLVEHADGSSARLDMVITEQRQTNILLKKHDDFARDAIDKLTGDK